MATLASITLFECDKCKTIIKCQTDTEWRIFEETWSDGILHQFCPTCKIRPEIKILIEEEKTRVRAILNEHTDILNAEEIS